MLEKTIEKTIVQKANELGFLTYKFGSPCVRGVPDRMFICPSGNLFFIEFKSVKGKLSALQEQEINKLIKWKQKVYVVNNIEIGLEILTKMLCVKN